MLPAGNSVFKTVCPDKHCQSVLYVYSSDRIVECFQCGQKHSKESFRDLREVPSEQVKGALQGYLYRMLINRSTPKRGTEMVKVLGLSNYHCKILSPHLTTHGMDKNTGRAILLTEMNQGKMFDCSLLSDRAFLIEPEHISIHGYGKDITGSIDYLSETLKQIIDHNGGEERLIPIHSDGDGHCLVHAISRALVGRELFWHPLRCCLKQHFKTNLDNYKELFKDFIDTVEWISIIEECDPDFQPPDGELHGLRNIHIFGLANVLRRPIILLDSLECMQKCGDYSALFLPGFVNPTDCRGKDNTLNKPLCIAWSSYSHNHYIPLVGVVGLPLPVLPAALIPKVWGMPQSQISLYMEFDKNGGCVVGGNRVLSSAYIQRLVHAMEVLYYETYHIHPSLVSDAKLYLFPDNLLFSAKPSVVQERARTAVQEGRLFRCLLCRALCEIRVDEKWLRNNSAVCSQYLQNYKIQDSNVSLQDLVLKYDSAKHEYVIDIKPLELQPCTFCNNTNSLRKVTNDGTIIYKPEDKDNLDRNIFLYDQSKKSFIEESFSPKSNKELKPTKLLLKLIWGGKEVEEEISYLDFHHKNKENLNEYVKELSKKLIEKHFSDKSSDVQLPAYVSEEIWKAVKKNDVKNSLALSSKPELKREDSATSMKLGSPVGTRPKPSQVQYVKVVTSNSQWANLALSDEGISYGQLQEWIRDEFNIPVKNQIIKMGVPPKTIKPCGDSNKQMLTDLKHGDRLLVEVQRRERDETPYSLKSYLPPKNILKKKSTIPKITVKYPCDTSWEVIKKSPAYFRRYGFMYEKIAENHDLDTLLHISLEEYPNKVFCYNANTDSIELCIKPYGHFLISADLEKKVEQIKNGQYDFGFSKCPLSDRNELNEDLADLWTDTSFHGGESSAQSLLRKGPGFSVLRNPDDMDFS